MKCVYADKCQKGKEIQMSKTTEQDQTDLCTDTTVIQSLRQCQSQAFRKVLFQNIVQSVPPDVDGQNCQRRSKT